MKTFKSCVLAVVLVSTISISAFGGEIETPGFCAPPPPPSTHSAGTSDSKGSKPTDVNKDQSTALVDQSDLLLVDVLAALLSIF